MFLTIFVPLVYYLAGKREEPVECYRDTTRLLCDWFYDRPSTSSQAHQYATTSPQPELSYGRKYGRSDMSVARNSVYPESDQYWNDRFKQLKTGPNICDTAFPYDKVTSAGPVIRPRLLPRRQIWCGGMTTPFQAAMRKLCAASGTDVEAPSDEGSSVDPSYPPVYKTDCGAGSTGHPQSGWSLVGDLD